MAEASVPSIEKLLADGAWIRGLAVGLIGECRADDAVQDVWLAALRSGPRTGANPRGWLATVLKHAAGRIRRGERRRGLREASFAEDTDEAPSTLEVVERFSTQQAVAAAVLELDPEHRAALLLRFYEDLTLSRIAAREGISVSTAQERVQEGLDRLRRRLERRLDARDGRLAVLLWPLARPARVAPSALAVPAVAWKLLTPVLLAAIAWGLWHGLVSDGAGSARRAVESNDGLLATLLEDDPASREDVSGAGPRLPLHAAELQPLPATGNTPRASLTVLVASPDEELKARDEQVTVTLYPGAGSSSTEGARSRVTALARPLSFEGLSAGVWFAETDRGGRIEARLEPGTRTRLELELPPGPGLRGVVVGPDGAPVSGASVWLSPRTEESWAVNTRVPSYVPAEAALRTGPDGTFRFASIGQARTVGARASGMAPSADLRLSPGATGELEVRLELPGRGGSVSGVVRDPSGTALAGASVYMEAAAAAERANHHLFARTDADGRFHFDSVAPGDRKLRVCATGRASARRNVSVETGEETRLEVELERGMTLEGRVSDGEGQPLSGAVVFAARRTWAVLPDERYGVQGLTGADGTFSLRGVPARSAWLVVDAVGAGRHEELVRGEDGTTVRRDVVFETRHRLEGRVIDEQGEGVPACGLHVTPVGSWVPRQATTDPSGYFRIDLANGEAHELRLSENGIPLGRERRVRAGEGPITLRLKDTERPLATLVGGASSAAGASLEGLQLWLDDGRGPLRRVLLRDPGSGSFRVDHVLPGTYRIRAQAQGHGILLLEDPVNVGPRATVDLGTLTLPAGRPVELDLRRVDGATPSGIRLDVLDPRGRPLLQLVPDDDAGAWPRTLVLEEGIHGVRAWGPGLVPVQRRLGVGPDGARVLLELEPGRPCELDIRPAGHVSGRPRIQLTLRDARGVEVLRTSSSDHTAFLFGLRPGFYAWDAQVPGEMRGEGSFTVVDGSATEPLSVPIVLRPL